MKEANYTQVSNEFIESMYKYTGAAVKVFFAISRKTRGWHKVSDKIPYSQLQKITGIVARVTLQRAIKTLIDDGWITRHGDEKRGYTYDLNIETEAETNTQANVNESSTKRQRIVNESLNTSENFEKVFKTPEKEETRLKSKRKHVNLLNTQKKKERSKSKSKAVEDDRRLAHKPLKVKIPYYEEIVFNPMEQDVLKKAEQGSRNTLNEVCHFMYLEAHERNKVWDNPKGFIYTALIEDYSLWRDDEAWADYVKEVYPWMSG